MKGGGYVGFRALLAKLAGALLEDTSDISKRCDHTPLGVGVGW